MRRKKILYAAMFILALSTISLVKTYAASTTMPGGTVIIGAKAYDLSYANDLKNQSEISEAIVAGGYVYVKDFNGTWIDNSSTATVNASVIPSVTYKNSTGVLSNYSIGDVASGTTPVDTTGPLEIISIE